jgi:superfamily II DNA or RNA helicase
MAVVPAAGKTTACLKAAHEGLLRGWFGRIVVVVPSRNLVEQWIGDAAEKGIALQRVEDYGGGITRPEDSGGIVTTYQSVAADPNRFRAYTSREPTLVIGDEIHHCGEQDHLAWGIGMKKAFQHDKTMRLVSSGTPFRTDSAAIPFVRYDDKLITLEDGVQEIQRVANADFEFNYGEALRDGIVRDIFFPTWDGKMSWRRAGQEHTHTFQDDLDAQLASDRLKAALDPRGEWMTKVIQNAHERLMTIRREEGHPNAAGLIICKDQSHAEAVAKLVEQVTGIKPALAHSDIPEAQDVIRAFKKEDATAPWIVTVRMVSEGVDIKRLRVGIYATTYKTRLYFIQAIARTTRYDHKVSGLALDGEPVGQPAWFYVPDDPDLQAYMAQLMEISIHHIAEGMDRDDGDFDPTRLSDGQTTFLDGYEFIDGVDAVETGHFYEERKWTPEDMANAMQMARGITALDHVPPAAIAMLLERAYSQQPPTPLRTTEREPTPVTPAQKRPVYQEERDTLKHACSQETRRFTYLLIQINQPPRDAKGRPILDYTRAISIVTMKLNQRFGVKNIGECSNKQLEERRELLARWINDILREKWDPTRLG